MALAAYTEAFTFLMEEEMVQAAIQKLTAEDFKTKIAQGVTLIDFYADWCGPCRMLAPVLEKVASELQGQATIAKVDIDHYEELAIEHDITSVPTMILFKDGKEAGRLVGLRDAAQLKEFILSAR